MTTLRATFDGNVLVPVGQVSLPTGTVLEIDVREPGEPAAGSPEFARRAMREMPPLKPGDIDALEQAINGSKLPVRDEPVFDDGADRCFTSSIRMP